MVESVSSKSERRESGGSSVRILEIQHYPKTGGVRVLSVDKSGDGGYVVRIAYANRQEKRNEVQAMKLDEHEMAYLVLRLFAEVLKVART